MLAGCCGGVEKKAFQIVDMGVDKDAGLAVHLAKSLWRGGC